MATTDQLTAWLAEAEAARHAIAIGGNPQSISSASGKSVTYSTTTLAQLDSYIASLRRQLGQPSGAGPLTFQIGGH
jgi:hypothetical protein